MYDLMDVTWGKSRDNVLDSEPWNSFLAHRYIFHLIEWIMLMCICTGDLLEVTVPKSDYAIHYFDPAEPVVELLQGLSTADDRTSFPGPSGAIRLQMGALWQVPILPGQPHS